MVWLLIVLLAAVAAGGALAGAWFIRAQSTETRKRRAALALQAIASIGLLAFAARDIASDPPRWSSAGLAAGIVVVVAAGAIVGRRRARQGP